MSHTATLVAELTVLVLAIFLGFEVISKVPTMLHTPLMSGTNAIHGIVIVGAMIVAGSSEQDGLIRVDRVRRGGARRRRTSSAASSSPTGCSRCSRRSRTAKPKDVMGTNAVNLLYLVTIVCFVLALRSCRRRRRRGAATGSARSGWWSRSSRRCSRRACTSPGRCCRRPRSAARSALVGARRVKMTAMPQMVALFNGVGGGAAALVALAEFHELAPASGRIHGDISVAILLSALIGSISFSGSLIAFAKLQELIKGRPITYPGPEARQRGRVPRLPRARRRDPRRHRAPVAALGAGRRRARLRRACSCCRSAAPTCRS